MTLPNIVANLHSCVNETENYTLNSEAFSHHTANFRRRVVDESFARVGIFGLSTRLLGDSEFTGSAFLQRDPSTLKAEDAFQILEDLADRRNDVAHGEPSEILSNDYLIDYIKYLECYGKALWRAVHSDTLPFLATHLGICLGAPIQVFNNEIIAIELKNIAVEVGDVIIGKTGTNTFVASEVKNIQVNNVNQLIVPACPSIHVGIQVTFHAKPNQEYFLVPKDRAQF